jgi:ABC-type transport system substrate-binding protein
MRPMPIAILLGLMVTWPVSVSAAPPGTVIVAQGVDPTTLDPMNHQETPAANLARNMFDTLLERDEKLVIQPAVGGHRGAAHQGGDPDDAADPRVGKLPQQHGVRP